MPGPAPHAQTATAGLDRWKGFPAKASTQRLAVIESRDRGTRHPSRPRRAGLSPRMDRCVNRGISTWGGIIQRPAAAGMTIGKALPRWIANCHFKALATGNCSKKLLILRDVVVVPDIGNLGFLAACALLPPNLVVIAFHTDRGNGVDSNFVIVPGYGNFVDVICLHFVVVPYDGQPGAFSLHSDFVVISSNADCIAVAINRRRLIIFDERDVSRLATRAGLL